MWNNPEMLEAWQTALQWIAISLVFLGAAAGIITLALQSREEMTARTRSWSTTLQRLAIVLVVLGGLVQVSTLLVDNRGKALSAVLDKAMELQGRAEQGSWSAYQDLADLVERPGPFQEALRLSLQLIQKEMLAYRDIPGMRTDLSYTVAGKNIPVQSLSALQMFEVLGRPSSSTLMRQSFMTYIIEKPKQEILKACRSVLMDSDSLPARAAACGVLARVLGTKANFLDCQNWITICQNEIEGSQQPAAQVQSEGAPSD